MNFIIIGDKFQKRMKLKGCSGLIKNTKNKTNIDTQYKYIRKYFPNSKILYITGFEHKRLSTYINDRGSAYDNLTIIFNDKYDTYNYAYSMYLVKQHLDTDSILTFGDVEFTNNTLKKFHLNTDSSKVFLTNNKNDLGCIITKNKVEHIAYGLTNSLSNIYYLSIKDILHMNELLSDNNKYKNFFIFELINILIDNNGSFFQPLMVG